MDMGAMNNKTEPRRKSRRKNARRKGACRPASFTLFADAVRQTFVRQPAVEAIAIRITADNIVQVIRIDVRA